MAVELIDWLTRHHEYDICDHLWPQSSRWYVQHEKGMTHEPAPHGRLHANQQALNMGSEQRDLYQSLPTEVYYSKGWALELYTLIRFSTSIISFIFPHIFSITPTTTPTPSHPHPTPGSQTAVSVSLALRGLQVLWGCSSLSHPSPSHTPL